MNFDLTLSSTFGLTLLLFIGLGFFIRASTKDRTEVALYASELDEVTLLEALDKYFAGRAYQVTQIDQDEGRISLQGMVKASIFLAFFLTLLAGVGLLCLSLITTIEFPRSGYWPYSLLLLAPVATWFYWRGATRLETVDFELNPSAIATPESKKGNSFLRMSAHRDELIVLESKLPLKRIEAE
ncbi:MAG: cofactor assembly of complex C subunit B [Cyanobacteria bacterium P01_H01_bin.58]